MSDPRSSPEAGRQAPQGPAERVLEALSRGFSPFTAMRDVRQGSFEQRAAAHRHNRRMRGALSICMLRWAVSCAVALALTAGFDALGAGARGTLSIFVLLAAACATFIACGVCVLCVSAYVYVHLAHDD